MSTSPSSSGVDYESISTINLYNPTSGEVVDALFSHINQLGSGESGDLPPFVSLTKLKRGRIYTIKKIVMRVKGIDNAPLTGIQVYLDNCRSNLPSK